MNLKQLETFIATTKHNCNLSQTAAALYISQTAITKQIQALEEELGLELFDRVKKHLILNDAGKLFLKKAENILELVDKTKNEMLLYSEGEAGHLKLGILRNIEVKTILKYLKEFLERHPQTTIEIIYSSNKEMNKMLEKGEIDGYFGLQLFHHANHFYIPIEEVRMSVICSKADPLSKKEYIRDGEIYPIIYDIRNISQENLIPVENIIFQIACRSGYAIMHAFSENSFLQEEVTAVPLYPYQKDPLYFIYDKEFAAPAFLRLKDYLFQHRITIENN